MEKYGLCFLAPSPSLAEAIGEIIGISRSQLIKRGLKKKDLNQRIDHRKEVELPLSILNYGLINPVYQGQEFKILEENTNIVSIEKPVKVHCHPLHYDESDNILSGLRAAGRDDLLSVNPESYDRGLLYRLDFETSGLLLYVKNTKLLKELRVNFQTKVKRKTYLAKVHGEIKEELLLKNSLKPSAQKGSKMKEAVDGVEANIKVLPVKNLGRFTIVEIDLNEGVRHQIRVQLSLAGFSILGDPLYGDDDESILHLHCLKYEIESIGSFEAPYPNWYTP